MLNVRIMLIVLLLFSFQHGS